MPKQLKPAITFVDAINAYFGGVHGLAKMSIPFTCKCGSHNYPEPDYQGVLIDRWIMNLEDCFKHIRKVHKEKIRHKVN